MNDMVAKKENDKIEHFSSSDIIISFYGAFLIAAAFLFKGNLLLISQKLDNLHLGLILLVNLIILSVEIYYMGYSRVKNKKQRPFAQFLIKRITTTYLVSLIVSLTLVLLYNIDHIIANGTYYNIAKIVICVSFPASIGATATDLFKKF